MLQETQEQTTPLTKQINSLTRLILGLAGVAFVAIVIILRVREGDSWSDLFNVGVRWRSGDSGCPPRRRHGGARARHGAHVGAQRDRQDVAIGGGARVDLRDLHRQDGTLTVGQIPCGS